MIRSTTPSLTRLALVTGGAKGIGWAICQRLARDGYRVALADVDAEAARQGAAALGQGHVAIVVDLTDPLQAAQLPQRAAGALGGLSLIVNNAGMTDSSGVSLTDMPQDSFDRIVGLNLTAVEKICSSAVDMLGAGGCVINIASGAAFRPLPYRGPYSATKAAVVALTQALAPEFFRRNLRINAVAPGYTQTPLVEELGRAGRLNLDSVAASIPLGRLAMPADIADAVSFLASPSGVSMAGQVMVIDGGNSAGAAVPAQLEPGNEASGAVVALGALLSGDAVCATLDDLPGIASIAAVIDTLTMTPSPSTELVLERARRTAQACARHTGRTRNFSLLFVMQARSSVTASTRQAALSMFARVLAMEWAGAGIRVNALIWHGGPTSDPGALSKFLAGDEAGYITGQALEAGHMS